MTDQRYVASSFLSLFSWGIAVCDAHDAPAEGFCLCERVDDKQKQGYREP